jgi:hypothetical protein
VSFEIFLKNSNFNFKMSKNSKKILFVGKTLINPSAAAGPFGQVCFFRGRQQAGKNRL